MALKSLYRVCEIKKLDLIFSSFSVRSQNHSYKNSIVFRLARHFVLKHITSYHAMVRNLSSVTDCVRLPRRAGSGLGHFQRKSSKVFFM